MKRILSFVVILALAMVVACSKSNSTNTNEPQPEVQYLLGGEQESNGFHLWIWIYKDETEPACVRSGAVRFVDGTYVDTDEEYLSCLFTEDGFVLSDIKTGEARYEAQRKGAEENHTYHISWSHSPGATWDTYAETKGWQREMNISLQSLDGLDDIIK